MDGEVFVHKPPLGHNVEEEKPHPWLVIGLVSGLGALGMFGLLLASPSPHPTGNTPAAAAAGNGSAVVAATYSVPVPGHVVREFEAPITTYAAGHRGVDLATTPGEEVHADSLGTVAFAGQVAGRGVVVIEHPDGVRTEFEPITPTVEAGSSVHGGSVIGTVHGLHAGCGPSSCLHWGARRGAVYFDPLTLLNALGPVRLLPWGASGPTPSEAESGSGVGLGVRLAQPFHGDVRVQLRRGEAGVAE